MDTYACFPLACLWSGKTSSFVTCLPASKSILLSSIFSLGLFVVLFNNCILKPQMPWGLTQVVDLSSFTLCWRIDGASHTSGVIQLLCTQSSQSANVTGGVMASVCSWYLWMVDLATALLTMPAFKIENASCATVHTEVSIQLFFSVIPIRKERCPCCAYLQPSFSGRSNREVQMFPLAPGSGSQDLRKGWQVQVSYLGCGYERQEPRKSCRASCLP